MSDVLVHKETLGVLQWYWDGISYITFDGVLQPKMVPVTLDTYGLSHDEWWEVPNSAPLAKRIAWSYPYFDPIVADGELVGIDIWPAWKRYGEEPPEEITEMVPAPKRKKYNRRRTRT